MGVDPAGWATARRVSAAEARAPADALGSGVVAAVLLLFWCSGATGLMLEVVWSRKLVALLGATTWSVMAVLVAFMGGLGLGSVLWGRWVGRAARPLRWYGWLEIGVGLYTLTVPWLFDRIGEGFVRAARALGYDEGGGIGLRATVAVLALAAPTILMGGTLPVLTRVVASLRGQPGRVAGILYAVNTAGAVVGCFVTGFVLILSLGVDESNALAALIDLAIGGLALWLARRLPSLEMVGVGIRSAPVASEPRRGQGALLVAMVSGFCGLAYEVLWTRGILIAIVDSTTYAFTLMLTAFLFGHAFGSGLADRWDRDRIVGKTWTRLGLSQIVAGLFALGSLPLLIGSRGWIDRMGLVSDASFWGFRVPFFLTVSLAVLAPPAAFLGASFPLAARLYVGRGRPAASSAGRLYGLNTLGAIVGAIAAAAWLVPWLGTQAAVIGLAVSQGGLGAVVMLLGGGRVGWPGRLASILVLALVGLGLLVLNEIFGMRALYASKEPGRMVAIKEGPGATVTVHQRTPEDRVININGTNVAGTNPVLRTTQKLQGHLPVFLHKQPRTVLQIGFGSGGTCYSVSLHEEIERIDVCEISPDVIAMSSKYFADIHHNVLDDARVHTHIADARSFVAATSRTFDLILSDSIHPRFRGNAALYTVDYFALCARRLKPGGIVSTWLPLYGLSVDDVRSVLKSMRAVFPHVQVWYPNAVPNENTVILASMEPLTIDVPRLETELARPVLAEDLAEVGIRSVLEFVDAFLMGDRAVSRFTAKGRLNTDDHPYLEFLAPKTLDRFGSWRDNLEALVASRERINPYLEGASPEFLAELDRWQTGTERKLAAQVLELQGRPDEAVRAYDEAIFQNPDDLPTRRRLVALRASLRSRP